MTCWCGLRRWPRDGACIAGHRTYYRSPERERELRALADWNEAKAITRFPEVGNLALTPLDERNIRHLMEAR